LAVTSIAIVVCLAVLVLLVIDHRQDARFERLWRRDELPKLERALRDNTAWVRRVQPNQVIEIWQYEDEGDGYIFDVGNGKLLYLKGQWTEFDDENAPWPNTDFEIIRTSRDHLFLDIICLGQKLEPIRAIASSELIKHDWEEHDELFDGDLNAYADSLVDEFMGNNPLD
jgi:hypothetical protein